MRNYLLHTFSSVSDKPRAANASRTCSLKWLLSVRYLNKYLRREALSFVSSPKTLLSSQGRDGKAAWRIIAVVAYFNFLSRESGPRSAERISQSSPLYGCLSSNL